MTAGWVGRRGAGLAVALAVTAVMANAQVTGPSTGGAAAVANAGRMLGHTKRVLMVGAHPDDEDTELLTYLVRHEGAISGYLSLTRGEGGQNLIGPELGEALGLIRTEELLAARSLDGARQFFTRAYDFGFSKTLEETLTFWPRDSLLKDVVRIVRRFRPQILVSVFSGTPRDGHGHHQAAGWAAREAFAAAGDATRFPELLVDEGLEPWRPVKLYRSAQFDTTGGQVTLDGGRLDPDIGQSYHQIAMRSRSRHRSQDMGALQEIGPSPIRLALLADRSGGGPELFAGIDTSAPVGGVEAADLMAIRAAKYLADRRVILDAIADRSRLVAGQRFGIRVSVWNAGPAAVEVAPRLEVPRGWTVKSDCLGRVTPVAPGSVSHCPAEVWPDPAARPTVPYFLEQPPHGAMYRWQAPAATLGNPFEPPPVLASLAVDGFPVDREVVYRHRDQTLGEVRRPLAVVPRVGVRLSPEVAVWPAARAPVADTVVVTLVHSGTDSTVGTVGLLLPAGWPETPRQPFRFTRDDERRTLRFPVRRPATMAEGAHTIRAVARDQSGRHYDAGQVTIAHPHIRDRSYPAAAAATIRAVPIALPAVRRIGYVRGAADQVPEVLAQLGLGVEVLDAQAIERADLSRFQVVVIGSRAYETEPSLVENNDRFLEYVRRGGHLVVQYQQHGFFAGNYAPYPLAVARRHDRVTDETAPVQVLDPDDPIWRDPNRIGPSDWEGWVQERGLYFARTWDPRYRPLLGLSDPGEPRLDGGLLVASVGKGTYLYTGLAFFRQLKAGVPGAFRLFANLLNPVLRSPAP
ncbi:MAG: PIG-L family deacetylase [Gemmatimonadetes bacterium]|nr:PIG-L family deacetylase [Gemmatimonadota bacterium]